MTVVALGCGNTQVEATQWPNRELSQKTIFPPNPNLQTHYASDQRSQGKNFSLEKGTPKPKERAGLRV